MGISKTEVNLRRLLVASPHQQNQAKLIQYVAKLRELLEELGAETTPEGLTSVSKAKLNEYSEKIEALALELIAPLPQELEPVEIVQEEPSSNPDRITSSGLRRRLTHQTEAVVERADENTEGNRMAPVRLDTAGHAHIDKHRKLQEDLTDEMVVLAQQLKENSLLMNRSLQDTEKVLDSTEKAVEHSLAGTGRVNARAMAIYSQSTKTSCFTWLGIFLMTCIFIMVVLLIRIT
ncbi:unnamed protein product [Spirodela intermedia]|uniref:Uncharacterized protein n=1 Tax=Spirodela intermedia TaxID=51605 RepID=A0A7I8K6A0_SPIIN|nr:unnamed protein product [Spirodela intermedia]